MVLSIYLNLENLELFGYYRSPETRNRVRNNFRFSIAIVRKFTTIENNLWLDLFLAHVLLQLRVSRKCARCLISCTVLEKLKRVRSREMRVVGARQNSKSASSNVSKRPTFPEATAAMMQL